MTNRLKNAIRCLAQTDKNYYMEEGCAYLAIALNELYEYPIKILQDEASTWLGEGEFPEIVHVFVEKSPGIGVDIKGERSVEEIKNDFWDLEDPILEEVSKEELISTYMGSDKPLYDYDEQEVEQAKQIIKEKFIGSKITHLAHAIKLLATLLKASDLERLYELTYKYGWLTTEEKEKGWLPDKANMEKMKIEGELNPLLDNIIYEFEKGLKEVFRIHSYEMWITNFMDDFDLGLDALNIALLTAFDFDISPHVPQFVYETFNIATEEIKNKSLEEIDVLIEDKIGKNGLKNKKWVSNKENFLRLLWEAWVQPLLSSEYGTTLKNTQLVLDSINRLKNSNDTGSKVILTQEIINTYHNSGPILQDYVPIEWNTKLSDKLDSVEEYLDELSSLNVESWNQDLQKILGHPVVEEPVVEETKKEYETPSMSLREAIKLLALNINKEDLHTLWYENDAGDKFVPDLREDIPDGIPKEYKYQWSRFPNELTTNVLQTNPDGTSTEVMVGHSTWPEDLVLAMVESGDYTMDEAIIVCSESCSRCMNSLAHQYSLDWGFEEGSKEWQESNTECDFCRDLNSKGLTKKSQYADNEDSYEDPFERDYVHGACHEFTVAMHRLTGLPIMALIDKKTNMMKHSFVKVNDKTGIDAKGSRSIRDIANDYFNRKTEYVIKEVDEDYIDKYYGVEEDEIEAAIEFIEEKGIV